MDKLKLSRFIKYRYADIAIGVSHRHPSVGRRFESRLMKQAFLVFRNDINQ